MQRDAKIYNCNVASGTLTASLLFYPEKLKGLARTGRHLVR